MGSKTGIGWCDSTVNRTWLRRLKDWSSCAPLLRRHPARERLAKWGDRCFTRPTSEVEACPGRKWNRKRRGGQTCDRDRSAGQTLARRMPRIGLRG